MLCPFIANYLAKVHQPQSSIQFNTMFIVYWLLPTFQLMTDSPSSVANIHFCGFLYPFCFASNLLNSIFGLSKFRPFVIDIDDLIGYSTRNEAYNCLLIRFHFYFAELSTILIIHSRLNSNQFEHLAEGHSMHEIVLFNY